MKIGFITFNDKLSDFEPDTLLYDKGHECALRLCVKNDDDPLSAIEFVKSRCEAIVADGQIDKLYEILGEKYLIQRFRSTFEIEKTLYALTPECNEQFIVDVVIPMLNSKNKTFYNSAIFRTFGKTEQELKEILKDNIKNRNKIVFSFYPRLLECEVHVRYSSSMAKATVDAMLNDVKDKLMAYTYSFSNKTLAQAVAQLLTKQNRKLKLAESFTGGALAAELTKNAGASAYLTEGIVCYSNASKHERLSVEQKILDMFGAVSIETAYEMAAGLLMNGNCDTVAALTGYASSEDENQAGQCFIAVGENQTIHIFKYKFEGDRSTVIESGVKTALYKLFELMTSQSKQVNN